MTDPFLRRIIIAAAAFSTRKFPFKLVAITSSQLLSFIRISKLSLVMPALLTRTSRNPNPSLIFSNNMLYIFRIGHVSLQSKRFSACRDNFIFYCFRRCFAPCIINCYRIPRLTESESDRSADTAGSAP